MAYSATRNDVRKFAENIENLAKELQAKLDKGEDFMMISNELVRNTATMTFTIGEVYALEQSNKSSKKIKKTVVATTVSSRNYHNMRDAFGKFRKAK